MVIFVRWFAPQNIKTCRSSRVRGSEQSGAARRLPTTLRARGTFDAKTLALMNTPAEPVPTEDTSAVAQEQASLQEQPARSNPHRRPRALSYVADASNHSAFTCMQVRAFEMKMATRWSDADDEDTALPRMPWQTAAGSAWPWMHGRVSPPAHLAHVCARSFPELLSKCRSESVLVLQAASRMPACRCRS